METIKWLHISDLHLNKGGVETTRLREQLLKYLKKLDFHCDYVFCTGDIRYAPMGDFADNSLEIIKSLCSAVHVPFECFFITPGNHDINCNEDGRDEAIRRVKFKHDDDSTGYYCSQDGEIKTDDLAPIMKGTQNYNSVLQELFAAQSKYHKIKIIDFCPHKLIETNHLNIVILDSTLSYTQYQNRDLIVGTEYLQKVLKACNTKKTTVILTHYSFDFLDRTEQDIVHALLRDFNARLWLAGHEHTNLARKQRDYFYEFQCGNLLLESNARTCILIGELDIQTLNGEIQAHAWFSPDGWAVYPFVCVKNPQPSTYPFNLTDTDWDIKTTAQPMLLRQELRIKIMPMLLENQQIFENYGPTSSNRGAIQSERALIWDQLIIEKIIPNSLRFISLLDSQRTLLSDDEINVFEKYKMHIWGLRANHNGTGKFLLDAPKFPSEILSILK